MTRLTGVCLLALASCGQASSPSTTELSAAQLQAGNAAAASQITAARCDHEVACSDTGTDKKFSNRDVCTRELGRDVQTDLRAEVCPRGIDETKLSTCLARARAERCRQLVDSIDRAMSCRRSELCVH